MNRLSTEHEKFYNEKVKNPDGNHFLNQSGPLIILSFIKNYFLKDNYFTRKIKKYSVLAWEEIND